MTEFKVGTIFKVTKAAEPPYFPVGSVITLVADNGSSTMPYEFYCEGHGYSFIYADDLATLQKLDAAKLQEVQ